MRSAPAYTTEMIPQSSATNDGDAQAQQSDMTEKDVLANISLSDDVKDNDEPFITPALLEETDGNLTIISQLSNDSNDIKAFYKGHHRNSSSLVYNRLVTKIACTRDSIKKEQTARDANVNEYLKLAASADKQQLQRIKTVFEKKNQKSAHNISLLQKKLESYYKRYKDFQYHHNQKQLQTVRQPREMFRDVSQGLRNVGGNIRDGVSGLSATVMSKPREFAHLIKNKFGSADNINQLSSTWYTDQNVMDINRSLNASHIKDNTDFRYENFNLGMAVECDDTSKGIVLSSPGIIGDIDSKYSEHESECSSVTSDSIPLSSGKHRVMRNQRCTHYKAINDIRDDYTRLKGKLERLEGLHKDVTDIAMLLETERYRTERLEEQLNDLTELHQNEIENLKQAIADLEEKVQYQSDERLRDVYEIMENCQTRVSKMEQIYQQQYVTVEGIDNSNARAVVVKLINIVLTVLQVLLLLVATVAGIVMPFLKTRVRVLSTIFCVLLLALMFRHWPEIRQFCVRLIR
ncbi:transmembrane and coiled-coil domains protein 1 [Topomyia yanbarensis]|uniref:transmembrane and coiled-coil domains protein 1 n=1 Tax=Topomyia yanbarensis TaxID=2498891 RepID=UPI00273B7053|nr:transmembrane and coiled-coil domains protein 1 [Topomyia yanbarensis]XP_058824710.1 transmembrane and coiled-coil domains protein 1 [Topomyia yanbarensis]XP_058824711.1 transmembrane and coiled-coil domains protein 1 [Topomyia yanbarensis]XP_058824712.1 transmembrane and coiled-coil domains protein 1 [Topomyia yanbarensis]XP_058824714.1 transmembrane and coiled-coil domains protein 1 [Topomyia yanbarensis]